MHWPGHGARLPRSFYGRHVHSGLVRSGAAPARGGAQLRGNCRGLPSAFLCPGAPPGRLRGPRRRRGLVHCLGHWPGLAAHVSPRRAALAEGGLRAKPPAPRTRVELAQRKQDNKKEPTTVVSSLVSSSTSVVIASKSIKHFWLCLAAG